MMMKNNILTELSKEISYALRHAPMEYGLEMDAGGWVQLEQLVKALRNKEKWRDVSEDDIAYMVQNSEKKRHEISNGKIRAFYGHSTPEKILKEPEKPPKVLYHGTAGRFVDSIRREGLLPKGRQYVHLSQDIETAYSVGKRYDNKPCILKINAEAAWNSGVKFYFGNEKVWLADTVPSEYIETL